MIFLDDSIIKIGGVVLSGVVKSLEIKTDARIEEQEVQGKTAKPKQATGYEDAKVMIEIALEDSENKTKEDKLRDIQKLFRSSGQAKPKVYDIVNEHTAIRNVKKVVFKNLTTKETNKKSELSVSIELWEYIASTITATKKNSSTKKASTTLKKKSTSSSKANLNKDYSGYLATSRGAAPKLNNKTAKTPAKDTANSNAAKNKLSKMPY